MLDGWQLFSTDHGRILISGHLGGANYRPWTPIIRHNRRQLLRVHYVASSMCTVVAYLFHIPLFHSLVL